ncbi:hypothetical protein [Mycetocola tolaasinivorans]|uniref:hypothetical protein n=1 Tax=Mycetocola tolaasinivorans TaxID=76635 RepID=UPI0011C3AB64|nr:hypothetical protein [Mycetocola tolaasinivorans]
MTTPLVFASKDAGEELAQVLKRFRAEGISAEPLIFGAHRKPEAVVIPYELYVALLPAIEDVEIAALVRQREGAGQAQPLSDIAAGLGLDPAQFH